MGTALRVSFCFFCGAHYGAKFQEHCFLEILLIQYFNVLVANNMTSLLI